MTEKKHPPCHRRGDAFCLFLGAEGTQKATFWASQAATSSMGMRTCSMLSRMRTVTQWSAGVFSSPTVWKSTVMQKGVPISS